VGNPEGEGGSGGTAPPRVQARKQRSGKGCLRGAAGSEPEERGGPAGHMEKDLFCTAKSASGRRQTRAGPRLKLAGPAPPFQARATSGGCTRWWGVVTQRAFPTLQPPALRITGACRFLGTPLTRWSLLADTPKPSSHQQGGNCIPRTQPTPGHYSNTSSPLVARPGPPFIVVPPPPHLKQVEAGPSPAPPTASTVTVTQSGAAA
jgi:hypothetical protein